MKTKRPIPPLTRIANAEDEATGDAYEILEFRKVLGRRGRVRIERDQARDSKKVTALLIRKNADLPADENEASNIVAAALQNAPRRYLLFSRHVGWRNDHRAFVLQRGVIGRQRGRRRLRPPLWLNERQQQAAATKGDLATWKRAVAKPMRYSRSGMTAVAAAFAAPLLGRAGLQPFGMNFHGRSKIGKTTLLLCSTSLIGIGRESQLPNWNSTHASLQESARVFNDQLLAANEVGLLAGKKGDAYQRIRQFIYVFAEGRDTARHSGSSLATIVGSAHWRGIFLSTAEHSFNAYAAFAGEERDHGEFARCLDIPAARRGRSTIFDRRPKNVRRRDFRKWARDQLITVRRACENNHGVAIRPYIKYLIANEETITQAVRTAIAEFEQFVGASTLDGALQHAAKNCGLVYAGGCLGIQAGILPWSRRRLLKAVAWCFTAAISDLTEHENALFKARSVLRTKLGSPNVIERIADSKFGPKDHPAFFDRMDGDKLYTVHAKVFRRWFANQAQLLAVLNWLADEGKLKGAKKPRPDLRGTEWAEQSPRWPNHQNTRAFVFADPFGLAPSKVSAEQRASSS